MSRLRACGLIFVLLAALAASACTNRATVRVCDPCGCRCVAAPLVTGCGPIARPEETDPAEPAAKKPDAVQVDLRPEDILARKRIKGLVWEEVNLDQAVTYLRTITGLDFYISPKVREEKFEDVVYNLNVDDVSVKAVLDILTQPFGLRWEGRDKVVWILTREEIAGPKRLRYYDVKDLVGVEDGFASGEALLEDLRSQVHPSSWDEEDTALEHRNGVLIVRASKGVHDELERFIKARRHALKPYEMPAEFRKKLDATKVSVSISKSTLGDVIKVLQIQTGLNLMVDPRIAADVSENPVLGLNLKDVSLATALNMLMAAAGEHALWVARGNVLLLTHADYAREE